MAVISFPELVAILESSLTFRKNFEHGVPASQSLRIWFGERKLEGFRRESIEMEGGRNLVLFRGHDEKVYAIEICFNEGPQTGIRPA
jgi:hypothetical protein